jgi:hypothetical protein
MDGWMDVCMYVCMYIQCVTHVQYGQIECHHVKGDRFSFENRIYFGMDCGDLKVPKLA